MENKEIITLDIDSELLCQFRTICEKEGISEDKAIQLFLNKICEEKVLLNIIAEALDEQEKSSISNTSVISIQKDDLFE